MVNETYVPPVLLPFLKNEGRVWDLRELRDGYCVTRSAVSLEVFCDAGRCRILKIPHAVVPELIGALAKSLESREGLAREENVAYISNLRFEEPQKNGEDDR